MASIQAAKRIGAQRLALPDSLQGDIDRVLRLAAVERALKVGLPRVQALELFGRLSVGVVAEVVGEPAEGVDREHRQAQLARQEPTHDREVLAVASGVAPTPAQRVDRVARERAVRGRGAHRRSRFVSCLVVLKVRRVEDAEADPKLDLEPADLAVLDRPADFPHLEPVEVFQRLTGALDRVANRLIDPIRRRADELDDLVGVVSVFCHAVLLAFDYVRFCSAIPLPVRDRRDLVAGPAELLALHGDEREHRLPALFANQPLVGVEPHHDQVVQLPIGPRRRVE